MAGNQNACVLPIGWEMGPPFCTDAALLHAMNHLQTEHEGKNLCFIKETYTITFIHHKVLRSTQQNGAHGKERTGSSGVRISLSDKFGKVISDDPLEIWA